MSAPPTPVTTGPCARCRMPIRRYGEGATTLCAPCGQPDHIGKPLTHITDLYQLVTIAQKMQAPPTGRCEAGTVHCGEPARVFPEGWRCEAHVVGSGYWNVPAS